MYSVQQLNSALTMVKTRQGWVDMRLTFHPVRVSHWTIRPQPEGFIKGNVHCERVWEKGSDVKDVVSGKSKQLPEICMADFLKVRFSIGQFHRVCPPT